MLPQRCLRGWCSSFRSWYVASRRSTSGSPAEHLPPQTVAIDGLTPHHDVADNQFETDLFLIVGLFGFFCSTVISVYMFFPPDEQDRLARIGQKESLLPTTTFSRPDTTNSTFSKPPIAISSFNTTERQQSKSQVPQVIAPFMTPPVSPATPRHSEKQVSSHVWAELADHLRLPDRSMGMMSEAVEMNKKAWRAARKSAENEMVPPGVGTAPSSRMEMSRAHEPSAQLRPAEAREVLASSSLDTEREYPKAIPRVAKKGDIPPFRPLPPPLRLRSPLPREDNVFDREERDDDDDDLVTIVLDGRGTIRGRY
ncbi:hypothetical protein P7C73_g2056, partial [Tremellales sp. Uapishka_1]